MERGDWEFKKFGVVKNCNTNEILTEEEIDELPFCMSHLWDMVKECGVNEDYNEY